MKAGWLIKPLGDVCDYQRGLTYTKTDEVDVSENVVLRATNIDLTTNLLDLGELKYINEKVIVPDGKKVKAGSLIICTASGSKSHLGKVAYIDDDYGYAFGGFMGMVTPNKELNSKFLFHLMTSPAYKDFIAAVSDGANINNLKFDDLRQFEIPLPPLPEQQRIVTLLDEAFDGIATAKAHAEKILQNARAIFESHLQSVFAQQGDGWVSTTIGNSCVLRSGTTVPVSIEKSSGDIPYVKVAEMTLPDNQDGITTSIRFLNRADVKAGWLIPAGAVIFPKRGGAILTNKKRLALVDLCADLNIMSVIPTEKLTPEFLYFYFLTVDMRKLGTGSSIPQINNYDIAPLEIAFPESTLKQAEIAESIRTLETECQALESVYQRKLTALDDLKKSLLHQAFAGLL